MLRLDLLTLQLLVSTSEAGSVSRAAEKAHLTTSAVSKRIVELESQLGITLLDRSPQGIRLTPAGQTTVQRVQEVLQVLGRLQHELGGYARGDAGDVRIASNTSGIAAGLARELEQFRKQVPGIALHLDEMTSAHVVQAVAEGRADLGICALTTPLQTLASVAYRTTPLALVVPESHPLSRLPSVSYQDSLAYPHIGRKPDSALAWLPMRPSSAQPVASIATCVTSFAAVLALVRAGVGIAVIPVEALKDDQLGGIRIVPLADSWMPMGLMIVFDPVRATAPAIGRVRAHLTGTAGQAWPPDA